jgi:hypothetical protein
MAARVKGGNAHGISNMTWANLYCIAQYSARFRVNNP